MEPLVSENKSKLLALPPELLLHVFDILLPQNIKQLRLVSKKMCELSSPYLFKRVYFALRCGTLAIFRNITSHAVFSQSVEEVVYDTSASEEWHIDYIHRIWRCECVMTRCSLDCVKYDGPRSGSREGDMAYRRLVAEQNRLRADGTPIEALRSASRVLKNLKSIVISDWQTIDSEYLDRDAEPFSTTDLKLPATVSRRSMYSNAWYLRDGLMRWDVPSATCLPESFATPGSCAHHSLQAVLVPFVESRMPIERVTMRIRQPIYWDDRVIEGWTRPAGVPVDLFLHILGITQRARLREDSMLNFFENMRHLDIHIIMPDGDLSGMADASTGRLGLFQDVLSQMKYLRTLRLLMDRQDVYVWKIGVNLMTKDYLLNEFAIKNIWLPKLEKLHLGGFSEHLFVDSQDLTSFLLRHANTLEHLELWSVCLTSIQTREHIGWAEMFRGLHGKFPSLKNCRFSDLIELDEYNRYMSKHRHLMHLYALDDKMQVLPDTAFRQRLLNILEDCLLGKRPLTELDSPLREVSRDRRRYDLMHRGPKTLAERQALKTRILELDPEDTHASEGGNGRDVDNHGDGKLLSCA